MFCKSQSGITLNLRPRLDHKLALSPARPTHLPALSSIRTANCNSRTLGKCLSKDYAWIKCNSSSRAR